MFGIAISIAIPMTIFAEQIISVLFGESYGGAVPVLRIYVWVTIIVYLSLVMNQFVLIKNIATISLYTTVLGATINVISNIILISKFGVTGSAWATLISYSSALISSIIFTKTRNQFFLIFKSILYFNK